MLTYTLSTGRMPATSEFTDAYQQVYGRSLELTRQIVERYATTDDPAACRLVTGRSGSQLAGFAYGCVHPPGWWWSHVDTEPPEQVKNSPKLAVYEWALLEPWRGTGAGRELITRLLAASDVNWATLTSRRESAAYQTYLRNGWTEMGTCHRTTLPPMAVMTLHIKP